MAKLLIRCPHCQTKMKVPEDGSRGSFRCPKCRQILRAPGSQAANSPMESQFAAKQQAVPASPEKVPDSASPLASAVTAVRPTRQPQAFAPPASQTSPATALPLKPFLVKWAIVVGAVLGVLLAVGLLGLFWEPVAMGAIGLCFFAIFGCLFAGQIWMAIATGKENPLLGIAAFFVPFIAIVFAIYHKGAALRGFVVYMTSFAPVGLALLLLFLYLPLYSAQGRAVGRAAASADRQTRLVEMIRRSEQGVDPNAPVSTAHFKLLSSVNPTSQLQSQGDAVLRQCDHYVPGSFQLDSATKAVSFQFRGPETSSSQYRLLVSMATNSILVPAPPQ